MRSFPTVLNPWFVLVQFRTLSHLGATYYYREVETTDAEEEMWDENPKVARIFITLTSAARVAKAADADVLTLYDKSQMGKFGREDF